ncbi:hypothetical protein CKAN_01372600 [Cinnamomum micranthum f. kanehirae]|uniref:Uncharacterized protein n=1 Tax=Cinnamomum micranthum f. kanehirae TaxID=337451 RepID=A0A3S3QIF8_9MAGN|nr:hypothetical protein CKAN_01372600 [Cinnamomum micranthum f. kanehirae]
MAVKLTHLECEQQKILVLERCLKGDKAALEDGLIYRGNVDPSVTQGPNKALIQQVTMELAVLKAQLSFSRNLN